MTKYLVKDETIINIADKIKQGIGDIPMTPIEMPEKINELAIDPIGEFREFAPMTDYQSVEFTKGDFVSLVPSFGPKNSWYVDGFQDPCICPLDDHSFVLGYIDLYEMHGGMLQGHYFTKNGYVEEDYGNCFYDAYKMTAINLSDNRGLFIYASEDGNLYGSIVSINSDGMLQRTSDMLLTSWNGYISSLKMVKMSDNLAVVAYQTGSSFVYTLSVFIEDDNTIHSKEHSIVWFSDSSVAYQGNIYSFALTQMSQDQFCVALTHSIDQLVMQTYNLKTGDSVYGTTTILHSTNPISLAYGPMDIVALSDRTILYVVACSDEDSLDEARYGLVQLSADNTLIDIDYGTFSSQYYEYLRLYKMATNQVLMAYWLDGDLNLFHINYNGSFNRTLLWDSSSNCENYLSIAAITPSSVVLFGGNYYNAEFINLVKGKNGWCETNTTGIFAKPSDGVSVNGIVVDSDGDSVYVNTPAIACV